MRIAMFTQWFDPEPGAAAHPGVIAREIMHSGHDLRVATGYPNYPSGQVFDGFDVRWVDFELRDGVQVMRNWIFPSHDDNAIRRVVTLLSFAASSTINAVVRWRRQDVNLVYSSPITAAIPALVHRLVRRTPYVLYVIDMWPESFLAADFMGERKKKILGKVLQPFCDLVYRFAAEIAVLSPGMRSMLRQRGVPEHKVTFIPASADESMHQPATWARDNAAYRAASEITTTVMYAGNFGEMQALNHVIEAARRLRERSDIRFVFVGGGVCDAALREQAKDLANVEFWGAQPMHQMPEILSYGDLHVVSLKARPIFEATLPSKLQATMAGGYPLIAAVTGDAARVVTDADCGFVVPNEDSDAFARAVENFSGLSEADRRKLALNARQYYEENFASSVVTDRLCELLEKAART